MHSARHSVTNAIKKLACQLELNAYGRQNGELPASVENKLAENGIFNPRSDGIINHVLKESAAKACLSVSASVAAIDCALTRR